MKTNLLCGVLTPLLISLSACATLSPYYRQNAAYIKGDSLNSSAEIDYSLFLAGGPELDKPSLVLKSIEDNNIEKSSGLILLGNSISLDDFSNTESDSYNEIIKTLERLDESFHDFFILPGQLEWTSGKDTKHASVLALDQALKDIKDKGRLLEPHKGCGEPMVIELTKNATLVLIDSQWAIESESRKSEKQPG
ncbi:MAG: hypothetical protein M3R25_10120, partial [Bacteroidota bacterium]|nr:hypothetical protein [Bacteroidota bacterium]